MIPWILLDKATTPDGRSELRLMRRGGEFSINLGSNTLMNSRFSGSEKALADLVCDRLEGRPRANILIGGLGMGFTLRAALSRLGPGARIVVAELVGAIVAWAKGPMAELFAGCLDDPRVHIQDGDVAVSIASARAHFDAILLDVDNGPEGLTQGANDGLYDSKGLAAARKALRPGGVLAVWSASPNREFTRRLGQAGFKVEEVQARANGRGGARHVIWLATKPLQT
jgi:spermidine synthase